MKEFSVYKTNLGRLGTLDMTTKDFCFSANYKFLENSLFYALLVKIIQRL